MAISFDIEAETRRLDAEKPYIELIDGIEVAKASAVMKHSLLQAEFTVLLRAWAARHGVVGTEMRVWLRSGPDRPTTLVPDIAYMSRRRLAGLSAKDLQRPPFAPDLAVEIRSPDDRERNVARKIELYLAHGARLVLDVQPDRRLIVAHDGATTRSYGPGDTFAHETLPGFSFALDAYFAAGDVEGA